MPIFGGSLQAATDGSTFMTIPIEVRQLLFTEYYPEQLRRVCPLPNDLLLFLSIKFSLNLLKKVAETL